MRIQSKHLKKLLEKYREISILGRIDSVLGWDLNVNLPPKAALGRAEQSAFVTELITSRWLDPEFSKLTAQVEDQQGKLTPEEKAILRNLKKEGHYYFSVPKEIIVEFARTTSEAFMAWQEAKKKDNVESFFPYLKKVVNLEQIIASHLGFKENPYDALLDLFEHNLTVSSCKLMFEKLEKELIPLIKRIQKSPRYKERVDVVGERHEFPVDLQRQLATYVLKIMGYDWESGRMDISSHPFTTQLDRFDIRITNRYKLTDFRESLMVAIHEGGHALYEQGVNPGYNQTPLQGGISIAVHESQSRFWENQVGKNPAFLEFLTPVLKAFYPELTEVGSETLIKLFNEVRPGLIRVDADEITYTMHIILRFEIENALINGKIKVEDVPEVWREKMKRYLGIVPSTNREGCLQDVHWSYGSIGYFPTYTLGNLYAAQITACMKKELPFNDLLRKGEFGTILFWLRENIHQQGSLYWPDELIKKVTGEPLNSCYFTDYIKEKYGQIYQIKI